MLNPLRLSSPPLLSPTLQVRSAGGSQAPAGSVYPPDQYAPMPGLPPPPGPTTGTRPSFFDRVPPMELIGGIALHVGGGALIAGGIGAGIALLAGGAVTTGLAIGAGVGAVLGGAFLAAVLAIGG